MFRKSTYLLVIILSLSIILRLYNLDFPLSYIFAWGDGTRDYFVANHIVTFGEYPLLGPFNLLYETGIYNTPVYYYLLAFFLKFYNSVFTLGVVNIFFQIGTVLLIYFIAKKMFDEKVALLSILLFSFNPEILAQSDYIWQPHLSQFFAYLALFLSVLFYKNNRYIFLIYGGLILALSFALHNSSFPWIPVFFIISSILLKNRNLNILYYLGVLAAFVSFLLVLYAPTILFSLQADNLATSPFSLFIQNIDQYFNNFATNLKGVLKAFNLYNFWSVIILILGVVTLLRDRDRDNKLKIILLLVLFFLPLFFASFFNKFRLHYLTLSLGVFTILIATIATSFTKNKLITILFIILLVKIVTFDFKFLSVKEISFKNLKFVDEISSQIMEEVKDSPFQIKSYAMDEEIVEYPVLDTVFLIPLEKKLNKKLAIISDKSPYNHIQTGGKEYFIVVCHEFSPFARFSECLETFKRSYPNYRILKNLYSSSNIAIYLSKHE